MTSAVVHSNRIEGVKEDKSVELEVKKFLIVTTQHPYRKHLVNKA